MRNDIEQQVRLDKRAEYLMAEANEAAKATNDISGLATKFNTKVDTLPNIGLRDYYLGRYGMEPKVQAHISMSKPGEVSSPIRGAQGVYFVKVVNRHDDANSSAENLKTTMSREYGRKSSSALQVLRNATKIKDNRNRFF